MAEPVPVYEMSEEPTDNGGDPVDWGEVIDMLEEAEGNLDPQDPELSLTKTVEEAQRCLDILNTLVAEFPRGDTYIDTTASAALTEIGQPIQVIEDIIRSWQQGSSRTNVDDDRATLIKATIEAREVTEKWTNFYSAQHSSFRRMNRALQNFRPDQEFEHQRSGLLDESVNPEKHHGTAGSSVKHGGRARGSGRESGLACVSCHREKLRCSGDPCTQCTKNSRTCIPRIPQKPGRPRGRDSHFKGSTTTPSDLMDLSGPSKSETGRKKKNR